MLVVSLESCTMDSYPNPSWQLQASIRMERLMAELVSSDLEFSYLQRRVAGVRLVGVWVLFLCFWGLAGCGESGDSKEEVIPPDAVVAPTDLKPLEEKLKSPSALVRRRAVRELVKKGARSTKLLEKAFDDSDVSVRRNALRGLCEVNPKSKDVYLQKGIDDPEEMVRLEVVAQLAVIKNRNDLENSLLQKARKDKSKRVFIVANDALWPFRKQSVSIRERKDLDYDLEPVSRTRLPKAGWKFHRDSVREGHLKRWYEVDFDDSKWSDIEIEQAWQKAGHKYIGVAWYRTFFELPAKPEHIAVELHFGGVDENAWVWVNGKYVGQHTIGPVGWDQPFRLDVTRELKWGQKNQITVRAMNTANAGGIWRPVTLEVLKLNK